MTVVDRLHNEFSEISKYLGDEKQISFQLSMAEYFGKNLLLCAASYFEAKLTADVQAYCKEIVGKNNLVPEFIRVKAVSRQYHTWFDWDKSNANKFFSLFGIDFTSYMNEEISRDDKLGKSIADFIKIGFERNRLVHQNFGLFTLEKTTDEIYKMYSSACHFVDGVPRFLRECSSKPE